MTALQSGMTNIDVDLEDRVPQVVQGVDDRHDGMLPDDGRPRRGLPLLVVAPRPGFQRGASSSGSPSSCGPPRAGRRLPTDGADSFGRSSRPSSHAVPAVRAPFARSDARSAWSSLTTSSAAGRRRSGRRPRLVDQREQQLVGACAGRRGGRSARTAIRSPRMPESGAPSKTSSMPIVRRDDRPQPTDERGLRRGAGLARQGVEQVRAVDEQSVGAGQRVARERRHARNPTRGPAARLRSGA